jgi:hypothetical protein
MRITRPITRNWGYRQPLPHVTTTGDIIRGGHVTISPGLFGADDSGPDYKGMDPSDPLTYVRPWNPQPGMIAYLNFDGAAMQGRTPTGGLARGSQRRGARGSR